MRKNRPEKGPSSSNCPKKKGRWEGGGSKKKKRLLNDMAREGAARERGAVR